MLAGRLGVRYWSLKFPSLEWVGRDAAKVQRHRLRILTDLHPSPRMFMAPYAAASCSGVVLAFSNSQAALNSAIATNRKSARSRGKPTGQMDGDDPDPDAGVAFGSVADPADPLLTLEHQIVAIADEAEFQFGHGAVIRKTP